MVNKEKQAKIKRKLTAEEEVLVSDIVNSYVYGPEFDFLDDKKLNSYKNLIGKLLRNMMLDGFSFDDVDIENIKKYRKEDRNERRKNVISVD